MKESNRISELPPDLQQYLTDFITTRTLLNMAQVSKSSKELSYDDRVWMPRLRRLGFLNEEIEMLQRICKASDYKKLYQTLTSKTDFLNSCSAKLHEDKSLQNVPISSECISLLSENLIVDYYSDADRLRQADLTRMGLCLYKSVEHYVAHNLSPTITHRAHWKIGKPEFINAIFNDNKLQDSLLHLNQNDCGLFVVAAILLARSDYSTKTIGMSSAIIPIDEESFYFTFNHTAAIKKFEEIEMVSELNYKNSFILKITKNSFELLDYQVLVKEPMISALKKVFSVENFKDLFQQVESKLKTKKLSLSI